ncbi:MAG: aminotransferase class I/II-fold pyridoxal phosphate-dependent enzyme [Candidatus Heimdallarchaeota archaeon]|nr:aminotransferase class I/II-fold pyridoxal phosphate-dependent enzyme [Candidatus Heimdallarchaeota archaeon]MDH5644394.1 aminotransferase class I/II-fold pyridoxal phosphate-dependent enzyme [Candidatus Heimdallarchaeota archaeon]
MNFSTNLKKVSGSITAQIFAEAQKLQSQGKKILHLEIGQPDFKPIDEIIQATKDAIAENTQYTVSSGIPQLRKSVMSYYNQYLHQPLDPLTNSIITSGGKMGIFASLWSVVNPGDNVIILNPSWVSYVEIVKSLGANPQFIETDYNFNFNEDEFLSIIDNKTKACVLNSPCNPTGGTITKKNLQKLFDICSSHNILIISDEMYNEYLYDDNKHHSLGSIPNWEETGVILNGLSKTFSMTGYRLGYVIGNEEIIKEILKINQLTTSCPTNFAQQAGVVAFQYFDKMKQLINNIMPERRKLTVDLLSDLPVEFEAPKGAFYNWFKLPNIDNSAEWSKQLLLQKGVAVTPGSAFGPAGEGYIRLSFATSNEIIEEGIALIKEMI